MPTFNSGVSDKPMPTLRMHIQNTAYAVPVAGPKPANAQVLIEEALYPAAINENARTVPLNLPAAIVGGYRACARQEEQSDSNEVYILIR